MTPVQFLKVLNVLPAKLKRDSVYFVYLSASQTVSIYVTDSQANARPVGSPSSAGGATGLTYNAENKDTVNLQAGTPVTEDASGSGFVRADASANGKYCVGLLATNVNQNIGGLVQVGGIITLLDWTLLTGSPQLTIKARYYLNVVAGTITTTPPSIPGKICQRIGVAVDPLTLSINIGNAILL